MMLGCKMSFRSLGKPVLVDRTNNGYCCPAVHIFYQGVIIAFSPALNSFLDELFFSIFGYRHEFEILLNIESNYGAVTKHPCSVFCQA